VATAGMYYQAGRFVHYQNIIVFITDVKRYIFGDYLKAASAVGEDKGDDIEWLYPVVGFDYHIVYTYILGIYRQLDSVAGGVLHTCGEVFVDTEKGLPFVYDKSEVFEHPPFGIVAVSTFKVYIVKLKFFLNHLIHPPLSFDPFRL
jgi:hypothetical protein